MEHSIKIDVELYKAVIKNISDVSFSRLFVYVNLNGCKRTYDAQE